MQNRKRVLWLSVVSAAAAALLGYFGWKNGAFLPHWIFWEGRSIQDTTVGYRIELQRRRVSIFAGKKEIWRSPGEIQVQDVMSCDIDYDGQDELVLLCWKIGRFGEHKPFWIKEDEKKWSQHLFVYEYASDGVKPKWMSSYMGADAAAMTEYESSGGQKEILLTDPAGKVSLWKWDSWGFTRQETEVSFAVFGDLIAHEPIYRYGLSEGFDFLFEHVGEAVEKADIAVLNQETPLTPEPGSYSDYPRFATPDQVGETIADAGFDVVTCATNHMLDQGAEGALFTRDFFEGRGMECLGIGKEPYELLVKNGIRFALFNFTYGTNGMPAPEDTPNLVHLLEDEKRIRTELGKARREADFIIVFVHWGTENAADSDVFQKKWADVFLEEQVDAVIGTHPHVLQPFELQTDGNGHEMLLYYSIGNFLSAQPQKSCEKGGMAHFTVSVTENGCKITDYGLTPLRIEWEEGGKFVTKPKTNEGNGVWIQNKLFSVWQWCDRDNRLRSSLRRRGRTGGGCLAERCGYGNGRSGIYGYGRIFSKNRTFCKTCARTGIYLYGKRRCNVPAADG